MTITLTDELEKLVAEKVKSGAYKSADEVVMASLRLLKAQEEGLEVLRREIMRGVVDIREGRFSTYTTDDELETLSDQIISQRQGKLDAAGKQ
jgi:antitoxin ParD1/3/4